MAGRSHRPMFILDTNVVSELCKPMRRACREVLDWTMDAHPAALYLSVITLF